MSEVSKSLEVGKCYSVHHSRKGHFVGQLLAVVQTDALDEADTVLLTMKIDVRAGTDQAAIARSPREGVHVVNIRPSLVYQIELTEDSEWLRNVHVAEEELPKSPVVRPTFADRMLGMLKPSTRKN
jgi:hypothetical protein